MDRPEAGLAYPEDHPEAGLACLEAGRLEAGRAFADRQGADRACVDRLVGVPAYQQGVPACVGHLTEVRACPQGLVLEAFLWRLGRKLLGRQSPRVVRPSLLAASATVGAWWASAGHRRWRLRPRRWPWPS